jgi:hypothetical protein
MDYALEKPPVAIFLDIDGVLLGDIPGDSKIRKLRELFGEGEYSDLEYDIATSYFLAEEAVTNLDKLIERVDRVARVVIVLSSAWRVNRTVDQIKNQMFVIWPFSKYIIDKTPDDNRWRDPISHMSLEKYGFELRSRACQIDYWLRENAHLQIKSFVILDDYDEFLSEQFPHNFVHVSGGLLSEEHSEKAYEIIAQDLRNSATNNQGSQRGEKYISPRIRWLRGNS